MSGSFPDTAAETSSTDMAAIAAGVASAVAAITGAQASAAKFVSDHGAAVNNGHGDIGYMPAFVALGE